MQPRHAEPGATDRSVPTPKSRGTAPGATEKPTTSKPVADKPKERKEMSSDKMVEFRLSILPRAHTVCVVGTFNSWDTKRNPMQKDGANWKASITLPPGRYEYRFVADGQWLSDPNAKESVGNDFGSTNSVLVV